MSKIQSAHQIRVERFMEKAGQEIPPTPAIPNEKVRLLRARLIFEEALETIAALGFAVLVERPPTYLNMDVVTLEDCPDGEGPNLRLIADGCADLSVVTIGTLSACGIADELLLYAVDVNNLAKFRPGHSISPEGKVIKPPDHTPPDIEAVLRRMR